MAVQVYGCNHVAIEVDDAEKAVAFYSDVFNLEMLRGGEGAAWCKLGEHQFLAITTPFSSAVRLGRPAQVLHRCAPVVQTLQSLGRSGQLVRGQEVADLQRDL